MTPCSSWMLCRSGFGRSHIIPAAAASRRTPTLSPMTSTPDLLAGAEAGSAAVGTTVAAEGSDAVVETTPIEVAVLTGLWTTGTDVGVMGRSIAA